MPETANVQPPAQNPAAAALQAKFEQASALHRQARLAEAERICREVLRQQPNHFGALHLLGLIAFDTRHTERAINLIGKAIALKPDLAEAYSDRGMALRKLKRFEDALANYDRAIALKPDFAMAHNNRGNALLDLKRPAEALMSCDKAIALKPDLAIAYFNRGNALLDLSRPAEALANYDKAIALKLNVAQAYLNRGIVLQQLRRPADALASYDKAIALEPNNADAHFDKSICLLQLVRFEQGFRQYEWRKKFDRLSLFRSFSQPLWLGEEDIEGKTLFIWWEQGFGDTIQFCRYANLAEARGAKVIMAVQPQLRRLLEQISPTIQIVNYNEVPTDFDYHCPMLSLPLAFRATLETIPAQQQYLKADEDLRRAWAARLPPKTKPIIGLVWRGGTLSKHDYKRSIELEQLVPILGPDSDWICLQNEVIEKERAVLRQLGRIAFFGDDLRDFSDTAALLDLMDLVVTVDTSVAHLAGAMGKPVWILLPYNPDWRWLLDRDDSPWYPSARLFRQNETRAWDDVIARVHVALREFIQSLAPAPPQA